MKIFIDIGHPAHVHYFRNFIKVMESKGHQILVMARNREVIHSLLQAFNIKYINRGKGSSVLLGKIIYTLWADILILFHSIKFNPDLYLSHGSHYTMHISKLLRKPCISTGDSDHIKMNAKLLMPYLSCLLTPDVYNLNYGEKHIRFSGYMELLYLHPNYFQAQPNEIRNLLGLKENEKYYLLRFVAWTSFHDSGQGGISNDTKLKIVELLNKKGRVFISSEAELPHQLSKYKFNISPEYLHAALAEADLCISEGATTASESSILGTPTIYINSLEVSYCKEQSEVYRLSYIFKNDEGLLEKVEELLEDQDIKTKHKNRKQIMLSNKIDVTSFLVWFVTEFPNSKDLLIKNPLYQNRFR